MSKKVVEVKTNNFCVTDRKAFERLVSELEVGGSNAYMTSDSYGRVGFYADGHVFGIMPRIPKTTQELLKKALLRCGSTDIEKFTRTSVAGWEEDKVSKFLDEVIERRTARALMDAALYYIGEVGPGRGYGMKDQESEMIRRIQKLLERGNACIITHVAKDDQMFLEMQSLIITRKEVGFIDFMETVKAKAHEMVNKDIYGHMKVIDADNFYENLQKHDFSYMQQNDVMKCIKDLLEREPVVSMRR